MTTRDPIPDDIRRFVLTSIPSVAFLEALLLLHAEPEQLWDASRLAARLYISDQAAADLLTALRDAHFVNLEASPEGGLPQYRYANGSTRHSEMLSRLAATYATHLLDITRLIHSQLDRKAQLFAEAFKWRKDS